MESYNCSACAKGEVGHERSYQQLYYNNYEVEDTVYYGQDENVTGESGAESGKSVEEKAFKAHYCKALKDSEYNEMSREEGYNERHNAGDEIAN